MWYMNHTVLSEPLSELAIITTLLCNFIWKLGQERVWKFHSKLLQSNRDGGLRMMHCSGSSYFSTYTHVHVDLHVTCRWS